MSQVGDTMRQHHRELMIQLADHMTGVVAGHPDTDLGALVTFLKNELLPHADGEERHLYRAVEPLILKGYGRATDTMRVDHEFIREYVREMEDVVEALQAADPDERPSLLGRLQRLALQFDAILRLHVEKEERLYLPLLEEHVPDDEQQQMLEAMHAPGEDGDGLAAREEAAVVAQLRKLITYKQSDSCSNLDLDGND